LTASEVLPAVTPDANPDVPTVETYSMVIVNEVLSAVAVDRPSSLFVVQEGGKSGKVGGHAPEIAVYKTGCATVTDNKVRFLPNTALAFHDLDNMAVNAILDLVRRG
jgi:hypothetical protein